MKFRVTMKSPDCLYESVEDAAKESVRELPLSDEEKEDLAESRAEKAREFCTKKWFQYGEYLVVDVDTDAGTCDVVSN